MRLLFYLGLLVATLALGAGIGAYQAPTPARAQTVVVCWAESDGNAYIYSSYTSCPTWSPPASMVTYSTLSKFDPYVLLDYYYVTSTLSGCGACIYDSAFDTNGGSSGSYKINGSHSVVIPGYTPGYGPTIDTFSY
ncbi:MAG: hypothetical protein ACSLFM_10880 [Tepidiformaceae bacterium]